MPSVEAFLDELDLSGLTSKQKDVAYKFMYLNAGEQYNNRWDLTPKERQEWKETIRPYLRRLAKEQGLYEEGR